MITWVTVACAALMCACASAGMPDDSDKSDDLGPDASRSFETPDAAPLGSTPDAASLPPPMIDAAPTSQPDAALGSGLFCNDNSECTNAGECCVILVQPPGICGPGTEVAGVCLPQ